MPEPTRALTARYAVKYEGAFGRPFDHRRFNEWNALMKVGQLEAAKHLPLFYLNTGDRDEPDMILGAARVFDALVGRTQMPDCGLSGVTMILKCGTPG